MRHAVNPISVIRQPMLISLLAFASSSITWAESVVLVSPAHTVSAVVETDGANALRYRVTFNDAPVIEPSALGITVGGINLGVGVKLGTPKQSVVDETYATRGNHTSARNHYCLWEFPVTHQASGRSYTIQFRVYDDGVAYRYIVPGKGTQHVDGESSSWKIVGGSKVWYFERLTPGWKLKSYAGEWMSTAIELLDTATPAKIGPVQGTPLICELPDHRGYALITKAALYDYSGLRLKAVGDRTVVADFTEGTAGFDVADTIVTPWRATLLANDLNGLVNSDFIKNLNPAPDAALFSDTGYIKPGRCVWSWETIGTGDAQRQHEFVDYAAKLGYEYSLVDEGWKRWEDPWGQIKDLSAYGQSKGVGIFAWARSKDIRDPADNYAQMRAYLDRIVAAGVVGVKIDFMDAESKDMIDFEITTLREAAKRKLMIDFHGCHASTGEERTYPNEITREGIRGIELNKMKEGPLPASHNAALPFTRFVVGHADYTPVLYTNPGPTTCAHQLATAVVFNSPLQVYAEHPENLLNSPVLKNALAVTRAIPSVWDETLVLPGSAIGDLAAFARRSGNTWFVGIINGAGQRDYALALSFLSPGDYEVTTVKDDLTIAPIDVAKIGLNSKADLKQWTTTVPFKVETATASRSQTLRLRLAVGGGFVARFTEK